MSPEYYISHNGVEHGPYTMEQVMVQVRDGVIVPGDYIWKEGFAEWLPIERICPDVAKTSPTPTPPGSFPDSAAPMGYAPYGGYSPYPAQGVPYGYPPAQRYGLVSAFFGCVFSRYAVFSGRASRAEYWLTVLMWWLIMIPGMFCFGAFLSLADVSDNAIAVLSRAVPLIYCVLTIIPLLAVQCRRMHDAGYTGLLMIIPFVGGPIAWVICCLPGEKGPNKYGSYPLPPAA